MLNDDAKTIKSSQWQRTGEWREWMAGLEERLRRRREDRREDRRGEPGHSGGGQLRLVILCFATPNYSEF